MAKHNYTVLSEEGANRYGLEVGTTGEIDIPADEAKAVIAAGWVEPLDESEPKKKTKEG